MIEDKNIYSWQDKATFSLDYLRVLQFEYLEPTEEGIRGLIWTIESPFRLSDDCASLFFDVTAHMTLENRPNKDLANIRILTRYNLTGAEKLLAEDRNALREFIGHCGAMNWQKVIVATTIKMQDTAFEGHVAGPLLLPGSFTPQDLIEVPDDSPFPKDGVSAIQLSSYHATGKIGKTPQMPGPAPTFMPETK